MKMLKPLIKAPITKEQLRAYADASLDYNPIHLDEAAALQAGLPGIIAHGMLSMGFMNEILYHEFPDAKILNLNCRFRSMVQLGDQITISGTAVQDSGFEISCSLEARNQRGALTSNGSARLRLATKPSPKN